MARTNIRVRDESIYVRPDGGRCARYVIAYDTPRGPRKLHETFSTRAEARAMAKEMREDEARLQAEEAEVTATTVEA